jgi:PAS domain S-box-containing protein
MSDISIFDLFDIAFLQRMQDDFAAATGVASLITLPDGTPVTRPSGFTFLCGDIIRKNPQGLANCIRSDACTGAPHRGGPVVQRCLSGGLWEGGASICVGDRHVGSWLIGQVRDETQSEEDILEYARTIGENEDAVLSAFRQVLRMPFERFEKIARALFTLARELSESAYKNLVQAELIRDITKADEKLFESSKLLRESNADLRQSQALAHIGSWKYDLSTHVFSASDEACRIFGLDSDIGHSLQEIQECLIGEDRERSVLIRGDAVKNGERYNLEVRIHRKNDGALRTIVSNAEVKSSEDGNSYAIYGTTQDVTDQRQAENALWEYGELYRSILNASPDNITIADLSGNILMVSPAALKMFHCGEEALVGRPINDFLISDDRDRASSNIVRMFQGQDSGTGQYRALRPDGGTLDIEVNAEFIRDAEGKPTQIIFIARDITERKRAEAESKKISDRLKVLSIAIEQSPVTTVITDSEGLIEYVNPKFTAITGYTPEEAVGQNPRILKNPGKPKEDYKELWDTILSGNNWHGIFHNKKKNGDFYWESSVISPVKNTAGTITHFLAIKEDITDRKNAEEKIKNLLVEKELILKEVHHRIKNNMNTIYGVLLLQAQTLSDPSAINALTDAANRVKSMMVLYSNLYQSVDFSEISVEMYLPPLIDEILANFPNRKAVQVTKRIEGFILPVNKLQPLGIIINELLTNIMKYAFDGRDDGVISISASLRDGHVIITIEDNGNGMPESVNFEKSTGFGLVLVAGLTKQIDGTIRIERKSGTRIILEFER